MEGPTPLPLDLPLWFFIAMAFLTGTVLTAWLVRVSQKWKGRRNRNRGRTAEKRAKKVLKKAGYVPVEHSPRFTTILLVDGDEGNFDVTPDMLVEKEDQQYVVEVKRYRDNSGISNATVRRQVLEYMIASGLPCLLVQMPEGDIAVIDLPDE